MGVTLRHNSKRLKQDPFYHFNKITGYFGERVNDNRFDVRIIYVDEPALEAKKMFDILTVGGTIEKKKMVNFVDVGLMMEQQLF